MMITVYVVILLSAGIATLARIWITGIKIDALYKDRFIDNSVTDEVIHE